MGRTSILPPSTSITSSSRRVTIVPALRPSWVMASIKAVTSRFLVRGSPRIRSWPRWPVPSPLPSGWPVRWSVQAAKGYIFVLLPGLFQALVHSLKGSLLPVQFEKDIHLALKNTLVHGFEHIIHHSCLIPLENVSGVFVRGPQKNNGNCLCALAPPELLGHVVSVHIWHHGIKKNKGEILLLGQGKGFIPRRRLHDVQTRVFKKFLE